MDVALILDSSGSILVTVNGSRDLTNWNLMKNFVITLIENLQVASDITRVALIRFSYVADVIFPLDQYYRASGAVEVT
jgi:von Willebrand factor type A domain